MDELGMLRLKGVRLAKNGLYVDAYCFLKRAMDKGSVSAINDLGVVYEMSGDYEESFWCYMSASQQGASLATCNMGNCYEKGLGVKKDLKKAIECYENAIRQGSAYAYHKLSNAYRYGIGVEKDEEKALSLCLAGAKLEQKERTENQTCTAELSYYYDTGMGIKPNHKKAFKWAKIAAKRGNTIGKYNLSECYLLGKGTRKNVKKGTQLLFECVGRDYPDAFYRLSEMYEQGIGVTKDKGCAETFLTEAMNNQSLKAYPKFAAMQLSKENKEEKDLKIVSRVLAIFNKEVDQTYEEELIWYKKLKLSSAREG